MGSTRKSAPAAKKAPQRRTKTSQAAVASLIQAAAARGYPFYVYVLSDQAGDFYVGKGCGNRMLAHGRASDRVNPAKLARIKSGGVERRIVAHFADPASALAHEADLIRDGGASLTNIARPEAIEPREAAMSYARAMLAKVLPFEQWTPPTWLRFPFAGFESPRRLYDAWIAAVTKEANDPTPSELHFNANGQLTRRVWT